MELCHVRHWTGILIAMADVIRRIEHPSACRTDAGTTMLCHGLRKHTIIFIPHHLIAHLTPERHNYK
jgi:hypothetical protein